VALKTALITGVTGQDGAYLSKFLLEKGYHVVGTSRMGRDADLSKLKRLEISEDVEIAQLDLRDLASIQSVVKAHSFEEVYNLAGQSLVSQSWLDPETTTDINATGTVRLLETLKSDCPDVRFVQASSSEIFGDSEAGGQSETTPLHPRTPYGVSKVFAQLMTASYRDVHDMHASGAILFNHESPLRATRYVSRKISHGMAKIALGDETPIELGNLDVRRDWGFAGDYVEAMWLMAQADTPDDYVLATGKTLSIRGFVDLCARAIGMELEWTGAGIDERAIEKRSSQVVVKVSSEFFRPAEISETKGDSSKAQNNLGWCSKLSIAQLAEIMVRSDYEHLSS